MLTLMNRMENVNANADIAFGGLFDLAFWSRKRLDFNINILAQHSGINWRGWPKKA